VKITSMLMFLPALAVIAFASSPPDTREADKAAFLNLFGIEIPAGSSRIVFINNGDIDTPRFELKLSTEDFEVFSKKVLDKQYSTWVKNLYDPREAVSLLERFLYGYARGSSVFFVSEYKTTEVRKSLVYDPTFQHFIAIYYRK